MARKSGNLVEIPLGDGQAGLARDVGTEVEFYDRLIMEGESIDMVDLQRTAVAFRVPVMDSAFKRGGPWRVIGQLPLRDDEPQETRHFKQDAITGELSIYWEDSVRGTWHEEPATLEDCADLERSAVWSASHVEDRLRDHFAGRPNIWVGSLAINADAVPKPL